MTGEKESNGVSFGKLRGGDNYDAWSYKARLHLIKNQLWKYVVEDPPTEDNKKVEFERKSQLALAALGLTIEDTYTASIRSITSPKELWQHLEQKYRPKAGLTAFALRKQFLTMRMLSNETMSQYLERVAVCWHRLREQGQEIPEFEYCLAVHIGLPDQYSNAVTNLQQRGTSLNKFDNDQTLIQEEERQRLTGDLTTAKQDTPSMALYGRGDQHQQQSTEGVRKCWVCGKAGHLKWQCNKRKQSNNQAQGQSNAAIDHNGHDQVVTSYALSHVRLDSPGMIFDTGSTHHLVPGHIRLSNATTDKTKIALSNGSTIQARARGDAGPFKVLDANGQELEIILREALQVPALDDNLIIVSGVASTRSGSSLELNEQGATLWLGKGLEKRKMKTLMQGGVIHLATPCILAPQAHPSASSYKSAACATPEVWHDRFGHPGRDTTGAISKVYGVDAKDTRDGTCKGCIQGKHTRQHQARSTPQDPAQRKLYRVHSDIGQLPIKSFGGSDHFITFIDEWSGRVWVHTLRSRKGVAAVFKDWLLRVQSETGEKVAKLRSDNGGEYVSKEFQQVLQQMGIAHETSAPYTPEQNGTAERINRTILEIVRCWIHSRALDKRLWAELIHAAVWTFNRRPRLREGEWKVPEQLWTGHFADTASLRCIGAQAWVYREKQGDKLDARSIKGILVGYHTTNTYKVFLPASSQVVRSRNVMVEEGPLHEGTEDQQDETETSKVDQPSSSLVETNADVTSTVARGAGGAGGRVDKTSVEFRVDQSSDEQLTRPAPAPQVPDARAGSENDEEEDDNANGRDVGSGASSDSAENAVQEDELAIETVEEEGLRRSGREKRPPAEWWKVARSNFAAASEEETPLTHREALAAPDASKWQEAIESELASLERNGTWRVERLPEGRKPIGVKWIFKRKKNGEGKVERWKARCVARGFSQIPGLDFEETHAPVARLTTLRTLIAVANSNNLHLHHLDVETAFLYGECKEELYLQAPEGVDVPAGHALRLQKTIYGLKQAGHEWNVKLDKTFAALGFTRSKADNCLYGKRAEAGHIFVTCYVDDLVLACRSAEQAETVRQELNAHFKTKDLGPLNFCLGLRVKRLSNGISIDQAAYAQQVLKRFGMEESRSVPTPAVDMDDVERQGQGGVHDLDFKEEKYAAVVGCLLYLSVGTRPDLAFAVARAGQRAASADKTGWLMLKRILRYLNGTVNYGLRYKSSGSRQLIGYSDADFADGANGSRSIGGWIFFYDGQPLAWSSRKQSKVALSSQESELNAASEATREGLWLSDLLKEFDIDITAKLLIDNNGAIGFIKGTSSHARTKHYKVELAHLQDTSSRGQVVYSRVDTQNNTADTFTKALTKVKFEQHRAASQVQDLRQHQLAEEE